LTPPVDHAEPFSSSLSFPSLSLLFRSRPARCLILSSSSLVHPSIRFVRLHAVLTGLGPDSGLLIAPHNQPFDSTARPRVVLSDGFRRPQLTCEKADRGSRENLVDMPVARFHPGVEKAYYAIVRRDGEESDAEDDLEDAIESAQNARKTATSSLSVRTIGGILRR
jgi:hypothetical protein